MIGSPYGEGVTAGRGVITRPTDLTVDPAGNVFIADDYSRTIRMMDANTGTIEAVAGAEIGGDGWADGHPRTEALFGQIFGVSMAGDGSLLVGEGRNATLRRIFPGADGRFDGSADERVVTIAGVPFDVTGNAFGSPRPIPDGTPALEALLSGEHFAKSLLEDGTGGVLFSDPLQNQIYRISPGPNGVVDGGAGELITRVAGQVTGKGDGVYACGEEDVPARDSALAFSRNLALDAAGNLFVADNECSRIRRVTPGVDGRVDGDPDEIITTVAGPRGDGKAGAHPFAFGLFADGPAPDARFFWPRGIAFDAEGNLYVADSQNARVRVVSHGGDHLLDGDATEAVTTVAGSGIRTGGLDGPGGDPADDFRERVPATDISLLQPSAVALLPQGNLLVAETDNKVVRELAIAGASLRLDPPDPTGGMGVVSTYEEFTAPHGPDDADVDSATLQLLDAETGIPVTGWVRRIAMIPPEVQDSDGDGIPELVLRYSAMELAAATGRPLVAHQRLALTGGGWSVVTAAVGGDGGDRMAVHHGWSREGS